MKNSLLICFIIVLIGCGKTNTNQIKLEQIKLEISESESYTPEITKITLETNHNCLIGGITQIEIYNDKIYILDDRLT